MKAPNQTQCRRAHRSAYRLPKRQARYRGHPRGKRLERALRGQVVFPRQMSRSSRKASTVKNCCRNDEASTLRSIRARSARGGGHSFGPNRATRAQEHPKGRALAKARPTLGFLPSRTREFRKPPQHLHQLRTKLALSISNVHRRPQIYPVH